MPTASPMPGPSDAAAPRHRQKPSQGAAALLQRAPGLPAALHAAASQPAAHSRPPGAPEAALAPQETNSDPYPAASHHSNSSHTGLTLSMIVTALTRATCSEHGENAHGDDARGPASHPGSRGGATAAVALCACAGGGGGRGVGVGGRRSPGRVPFALTRVPRCCAQNVLRTSHAVHTWKTPPSTSSNTVFISG